MDIKNQIREKISKILCGIGMLCGYVAIFICATGNDKLGIRFLV